MRDTKHEIVRFWFDETDPQLWFQNNSSFDAELRQRFGPTHDMAREGLCDHWSSDGDGCLALCLLLGQFPRHMHRGTPLEFETDEKALLNAKKTLHKGYDQMWGHEKKFFVYICFERSELMTDQKRNLDLFKSMERENPVAYRTAQRRYDVIKKFGRFPQRNAVLGRESTPEEIEWLKENGGF
jgi:uncharacterized protein (DUF924 family)